MNDLPLTEVDIAAANRRFDQQHGNPFDYAQTRIRSGWKPDSISKGKKLTDSKIQKYAKQGRYSEQYKQALRDLMEFKKT